MKYSIDPAVDFSAATGIRIDLGTGPIAISTTPPTKCLKHYPHRLVLHISDVFISLNKTTRFMIRKNTIMSQVKNITR